MTAPSSSGTQSTGSVMLMLKGMCGWSSGISTFWSVSLMTRFHLMPRLRMSSMYFRAFSWSFFRLSFAWPALPLMAMSKSKCSSCTSAPSARAARKTSRMAELQPRRTDDFAAWPAAAGSHTR